MQYLDSQKNLKESAGLFLVPLLLKRSISRLFLPSSTPKLKKPDNDTPHGRERDVIIITVTHVVQNTAIISQSRRGGKCWRIFQRFLRHLGLSFAPKPRLNKVIVYLIIAKFRLYVLYNSCHVLKGQLYPDPDPDVQNCKTQGFRIFVLIKNSLIKNRPHYQKLGLLGTS